MGRIWNTESGLIQCADPAATPTQSDFNEAKMLKRIGRFSASVCLEYIYSLLFSFAIYLKTSIAEEESQENKQ